jgi:hypothetical protein
VAGRLKLALYGRAALAQLPAVASATCQSVDGKPAEPLGRWKTRSSVAIRPAKVCLWRDNLDWNERQSGLERAVEAER